jgi:hypothetical protein
MSAADRLTIPALLFVARFTGALVRHGSTAIKPLAVVERQRP